MNESTENGKNEGEKSPRSMSSFFTPTSKKALHATPQTVASTPETPFTHERNNSDEGYLGEQEEFRIRALFREELLRAESLNGKSSSSRRARRQHYQKSHFSFDNGDLSSGSTMVVRRSKSRSRSAAFRPYVDYDDGVTPTTSLEPTSSSDSSPDRPSPDRSSTKRRKSRTPSPNTTSLLDDGKPRVRLSHRTVLFVLLILSIFTVFYSSRSMDDNYLREYEENIRHSQRRPTKAVPLAGGLRGKMVQMAGRGSETETVVKKRSDKGVFSRAKKVFARKSKSSKRKKTADEGRRREQLPFSLPPPLKEKIGNPNFDFQDKAFYKWKTTHGNSAEARVVIMGKPFNSMHHRMVDIYPADFTDNTQYYGAYDSDDERLSHMEMRQPLDDGECVPMQDWQTTYHPSCNAMHELAMNQMGDATTGDDFSLFGTKGFWRNAWKVESLGGQQHLDQRENIVLKTLKIQHNFEDAHFEHDRVDAVAMERLTSSPHVINIFGFCGHSVMTEYADGNRLGELADKAKKQPLARLRIARDIAMGLADVHGIDGDGNATFVHLDINPANVVSIGGTLKLNDFNIGILRRWNKKTNSQCGFPAQYPNPQWRSPEEARNEQDLTEKVDIFSMGHIFFRLICGHEPWNKLEKGGKPSKEDINAKVQRGVLPRIPDDIMNSKEKEVIAIRKAMLSCYEFDPTKRPSAREIANQLQSALDSLEK